MRSLAIGKSIDIDAPLLCSQWICNGGLRDELHEKQVKSGRILTDNAAAGCEKCFGAGMEIVPGKGARPCDHVQEN